MLCKPTGIQFFRKYLEIGILNVDNFHTTMDAPLDVIQFDEARKLWQKFARYTNTDKLSFELEIHKKLLNFFHVGEYYYYIFNLANTRIEMVSESVKPVLGLDSVEELTTDYFLNSLHPDDLPIFIEFEKRAGEFYTQLPPEKIYSYKVSYDYRMRRKDGQYIRILHQVIPIQGDENGAIIRTIGVHTNISHLKKETALSLSIIGLDGEPSFYDLLKRQPGQQPTSNIKFTRQEEKILKHLLEGKTSQQIADELCISKLTVDTHRRNMLQKTGAQSIAELTIKYLQGNLT